MLSKKKYGPKAAFFVAGILATCFPWYGTAVHAGSQAVIDVDDRELFFYSNPPDSSNLERVELPFTYLDILDLDEGCLNARIDLVDSSNVTIDDVDDDDFQDVSPTPGIVVELEADPDDDPVTVQAEARFRIDFLFDGDCDPITVDSVPASLRNFCVHIRDIDDHQFLGFTGVNSYTLADDSELSVETRNGLTVGFEPAGNQSEFEDEENWIQFNFRSVRSFQFSAGIDIGGDDDAVFDIRMSCAAWSDSTTTTRVGARVPTPDLGYYEERAAETEAGLPNTM